MKLLVPLELFSGPEFMMWRYWSACFSVLKNCRVHFTIVGGLDLGLTNLVLKPLGFIGSTGHHGLGGCSSLYLD
jgi:hypothetical protein